MGGYKQNWDKVRDDIIENWYSNMWDKVIEWAKKNKPEEYAVAKKMADQIKKQEAEDRKELKKLVNGITTLKRKFKPIQYVPLEIDIVKIIHFSYNIKVKNTRSGGTNERKKEGIMYDNFQGKLSELILYHDLPNKDDFEEIDLELYERGKWDHSDLLSKDGQIHINVKSGLSFHQMLLLTAKDYNKSGGYRHHKNSGKIEKELYAFVRLNIDKEKITKMFSKSEDDFTKWFLKEYRIIEYDQFFSDICQIKNAIQNKHLIYKDQMLNGRTKMDADNYYLLVYNMYQTLTELI